MSNRVLTEVEVRGAATAFTLAVQATGMKLSTWTFKKPTKEEILKLSLELAALHEDFKQLAAGPLSNGHNLDQWARYFGESMKTTERELESLVAAE